MKKPRYEWIISNDPLCDKSSVLVSQCDRPVTFVFSITYAYMSAFWVQGRHYETGWRFGCNIWFGGVACPRSRTGKTTVTLLPAYDGRGYLYFDRNCGIRASHPHYATESQCIEAAIRHVVARLDTTLTLYPDIVYYLLRPECDAFFSLYRGLVEKEDWLDEVRHPTRFIGLSAQLQLF